MKKYIGLFVVAVCLCCARSDRVVIASKNFSEQVVLGELLAQHIEKMAGIPVERKLNLGGTFICHQALVAGDVDLYVEYTGTALTAILKKEPKTDPSAVYREVKEAYDHQFQSEWTEPLGFNNTFAMIIRAEEAKRLGIRTISDAAAYAPQWKAGFGYEF